MIHLEEANDTRRAASLGRQRRESVSARPRFGARGILARALPTAALTAAIAALAGCAPMSYPPASPPAPAASRPAEPAAETARPKPEPSPPAARADSIPSPEAERVLATIPEPLPGSVRPATRRDSIRRAIPAPEAAYDTLRIDRSPEGGATGVPVPAPTRALGSAPGVGLAPAESLAANPPAAPPAATPATSPASPAASSSPSGSAAGAQPSAPAGAGSAATTGSPCWRVQVAAPATREEAESRHAASQSLLMVPMVIEPEKGLFKVRSRDCLNREAAVSIKQRALDSGFEGSFIVDTSAAPKPAPAKAPSTSRPRPKRTGTRR